VEYAAWTVDGQGVDRHLFGLKKMIREGEDVPEIYQDSAYSRTSHWELSTSQLLSKYLDGKEYGEGLLCSIPVITSAVAHRSPV
jgi:carnitine O-acetyltransferase